MKEIGSLIVAAEIICTETEIHYEFVLDTQFAKEAKLSYEEIVIVADAYGNYK